MKAIIIGLCIVSAVSAYAQDKPLNYSPQLDTLIQLQQQQNMLLEQQRLDNMQPLKSMSPMYDKYRKEYFFNDPMWEQPTNQINDQPCDRPYNRPYKYYNKRSIR